MYDVCVMGPAHHEDWRPETIELSLPFKSFYHFMQTCMEYGRGVLQVFSSVLRFDIPRAIVEPVAHESHVTVPAVCGSAGDGRRVQPPEAGGRRACGEG